MTRRGWQEMSNNCDDSHGTQVTKVCTQIECQIEGYGGDEGG